MDGARYLEICKELFARQRDRAERALAQLHEEQIHAAPPGDGNSVAVLMRHLAGNMLSRWTDFLTTDGEKPWRHRDTEFEDPEASRAGLRDRWEAGWRCLFDALDALRPEDLERQVRIRGEPHTVVQAIQRQLDHYGHHVGQLVLRARDLVGDGWRTLSVPRGGSEAYNREMQGGDGSGRSGEV